jgi:hypothetical protein
MANVTGTLDSPPAPGAAMATYLSHFMNTGILNPTVNPPVFRAGSVNTQAVSGPNATINLSANIVTGDLILLFADTIGGNNPTNAPTGFSQGGYTSGSNYPGCWLYWKFATATDPGSAVSWSTVGSAYAVTTMSYSNVNTASPFWYFGGTNNNNSLFNSWTSGTGTTVFSSVVVTHFADNGSGATITTTSGTQRAQISNGNCSTATSEQTYSGAATWGGQTATSAANAYWQSWSIVINGAPVAPATPSLPTGGWNLVDVYCPNVNGTTGQVWQSPAASNNANATWYLVFTYNVYGQNVGVSLCETYNATNHTWNACTMNYGTGATESSGVATIGSGTTPPYAIVYSTPNVMPNGYGSQFVVGSTIGSGSSAFFMAANRDGFYLAITSGGAIEQSSYAGYCPTLVSNPNLTDVPLFCVNFMSAYSAGSAGCTREPGWSGTALYEYGNYSIWPFTPQNASSYQAATFFGTINGSMLNNDLFLAPTNQALTARFQIHRSSFLYTTLSQTGFFRALLPSWIQYAISTGVTFGDTITEGGDTLQYMGGATNSGLSNNVWIDTTVA